MISVGILHAHVQAKQEAEDTDNQEVTFNSHCERDKRAKESALYHQQYPNPFNFEKLERYASGKCSNLCKKLEKLKGRSSRISQIDASSFLEIGENLHGDIVHEEYS
jgi:hypothetical protein